DGVARDVDAASVPLLRGPRSGVGIERHVQALLEEMAPSLGEQERRLLAVDHPVERELDSLLRQQRGRQENACHEKCKTMVHRRPPRGLCPQDTTKIGE